MDKALGARGRELLVFFSVLHSAVEPVGSASASKEADG